MFYLYIFITGAVFGRIVTDVIEDDLDWPAAIFFVVLWTIGWPVLLPIAAICCLLDKDYG